jgi:ATP-dependent Zn protease
MQKSPRARKLVPVQLTLCLALALLAPLASAAEATVKYTHESLQEFEKQLSSGQVEAATFNKRVRSVHLTLKDGRHVLVKYAAHGEPALAAQLQAKRVPVTVLKPAEAAKEAKKAPVKHKLRYIAGGILVVVIVIVVGVLLVDRRRKAAME